MSWLDETNCPVCGEEGFDPDCDQVDVGVGVLEGNLRGRCPNCGEVRLVLGFDSPDGVQRWIPERGGDDG